MGLTLSSRDAARLEGVLRTLVSPLEYADHPDPAPRHGRVLPRRGEAGPRQAEVALLLARGGSNREIPERLSLSPDTVRHHAQRVLEKLGIHSRKALALTLLDREDGRRRAGGLSRRPAPTPARPSPPRA